MASLVAQSSEIPSELAESKEQPKSGDASASANPNSQQSEPSASALPRPLQRSSTTPLFSSSSSTTTSREPRSRKNSQELSPNRAPASNIPVVPSAAAIQRALSAAGPPQVQSPASSEISVDVTRPQKPGKGLGGGSNHLGTNLPRVNSPPSTVGSSKSSIYLPRKFEQAPLTPSIILEHPTPITGSNGALDEAEELSLAASGMRTPVRGPSVSAPTLETVQESSVPATPSIGVSKTQYGGKGGTDGRPESIVEDSMEESFAKDTKPRPESGSESGGNKSTGTTKESEVRKLGNSAKPQIMHPKRSFTQLHPAKGKTASEGAVKNMTVETETVSTIPQVALGGGAVERTASGRAEAGGSLRLKPSNETIRPRKEKKKVVRKAPSINSGAGGLLSRRFHHHHLSSRPPSPDNNFLSLSTVLPTLPDFSAAHVLHHDYSSQSSLPARQGTHMLAQKKSSDVSLTDANNTPGPSTTTNAILTNLRGRTASSKADIFEAKVASAVDEVNSSDSEETFVYESNPPEPLSARPHRFHSRTPSATSMASQMDQYGVKCRQDGHHSIAGKKSMKFANNSYHTTGYPGEANGGTVRGPSQGGRTSGGNASHHHHIGRYGRGGHTSLFDTESPFTNTARPLRTATNNIGRLSSRPSSPRSPNFVLVSGNPMKAPEPYLSYDLEGEGADDERTPLVGSVRSGRNRYSRRPVTSALRNGYIAKEKGHPLCRRVTAIVSLGALLTILIAAIVVILIMCSQPLFDVGVEDIRNVLASEQEIMLDINVHAVNPNLIALQVSDLDVNIFAKSKHVGTAALWRSKYNQPSAHRDDPYRESISSGKDPKKSIHIKDYHSAETVDEGTDPIEDPETDSQTMLLGRIFEFDSPLIFDPSPIRHHSLSSIGEVRLAKPGNQTEEGGTGRWEKVIQHDFELIVRGVLRYSLPITSKIRSASISGSVLVHPGGGEERMVSTQTSLSSPSHLSANEEQPLKSDRYSPFQINFIR